MTPRRPPRRRVIEIRLSNGSLVDANASALMLGVFRNVDPSGAAAAIDARLDGAVREFTLRRMLSGRLGETFVLPCARSPLLAEFVLFAGLGDFPDFGAESHAFAAENAVRTLLRARAQDFATVLFGTGSGVPVAAALERQLRGYFAALRDADGDRVIRRITLCEIDPRRYAAIRRALPRVLARLAGADLEIVVDEAAPAPPAGSPVGGLRRRPLPRPRWHRPPQPARVPRTQRRTERAGDPAYLLVSLSRTGTRRLPVLELAAHRGRQGRGAERQGDRRSLDAALDAGAGRARFAHQPRRGPLRRRARGAPARRRRSARASPR